VQCGVHSLPKQYQTAALPESERLRKHRHDLGRAAASLQDLTSNLCKQTTVLRPQLLLYCNYLHYLYCDTAVLVNRLITSVLHVP